MTALELIDVSVNGILENLNLTIQKGEFVILIGANGAGKTTLFNTVSGATRIDSGKILMNGSDITNTPQYKRSARISSVIQEPRLGTIAEMTILENLKLAYMRNSSKFTLRNTVGYFKEKLELLGIGLENRLNEYVGNLSGGQRQLLSLVMAILSDYEILLLDEITAALDPKASNTVMDMSKKIILSESKTCLMITHDVRYTKSFGDRVLEMKGGQLSF
ncbi:MAG: ATP-binding cassette domain-containing protein [Holosporales bacterium]|jgi:putative ABC transport system ATP-binding protein|nr:ATP-binding cassette domain-containing protein [Holosporales bacterium]